MRFSRGHLQARCSAVAGECGSVASTYGHLRADRASGQENTIDERQHHGDYDQPNAARFKIQIRVVPLITLQRGGWRKLFLTAQVGRRTPSTSVSITATMYYQPK